MGRAGPEPAWDCRAHGDGESTCISEGTCLCDPCRCGGGVPRCRVAQTDPEYEGKGGAYPDRRADTAGDRERASAVCKKEKKENPKK